MLIRIELPQHLRQLAGDPAHELSLKLDAPVTFNTVFDALEEMYPTLRGTIRDHHTQQRRPFLRFFANMEDISQLPLDGPPPASVVEGREPLLIIAGIAGG